MSKIKANRLLLQDSLSGELHAKLNEWRALRDEIQQMAEEYDEMVQSELFLESEYQQLRMNQLEKEFYEKQKEFHLRAAMLRCIFVHPVYLN